MFGGGSPSTADVATDLLSVEPNFGCGLPYIEIVWVEEFGVGLGVISPPHGGCRMNFAELLTAMTENFMQKLGREGDCGQYLA